MSANRVPPDSERSPPSNVDAETTRQAGRGGLALSAAKVVFILLGLVQQIAITRLLGLSTFGALRGVMSPASITYNPLVTTGIQGMSRAVSETGAGAPLRLQLQAYRVHAVLGIIVAGGFWVLVPWLSRDVLHSPHLMAPLRISALIILSYGLYAPVVGILNGQRRFLSQASLDMMAALLRTVGLLVGGWLLLDGASAEAASEGWGPTSGAMLGFAAAALTILCVATVLVLLRGPSPSAPSEEAPTTRAHLHFILPVLLGQVLLNLLLQADTNTLRRFAAEAAEHAGKTAADVDALAGAYGAAQLFGFLPYQLLIGISFILFPMVARAHALQDHDGIARYTRTGMRLAFVIMGLIVCVSASIPYALLNLIFKQQAAELGHEAMQILVLGLGVFAVFGMLITVLNSIKQQWLSTLITALAVVLVFGLNIAFVRGTDFGTELLVRTAVSTSTGLLVATLLAGFAVLKRARAVVNPATVLRVMAAIALTVLLLQRLPEPGKIMTVVYSAGAGALYLGLLVVSRELGRQDLSQVLTVLGRRSSK